MDKNPKNSLCILLMLRYILSLASVVLRVVLYYDMKRGFFIIAINFHKSQNANFHINKKSLV